MDDLTVVGDRGEIAVKDVSFAIREGEIVGVAGVAGNGQRELAEALSGMRDLKAGSVRVGGMRLRGGDPREAIMAGVAHVPEDRLGTGLAPSLSVTSNVVIKTYRSRSLSRGPLLALRRMREAALGIIRRYDVKTPARRRPYATSPAAISRSSSWGASSRTTRSSSSSPSRRAGSTSGRSRRCTRTSATRQRTAWRPCS